jgi:hypothetical protein
MTGANGLLSARVTDTVGIGVFLIFIGNQRAVIISIEYVVTVDVSVTHITNRICV